MEEGEEGSAQCSTTELFLFLALGLRGGPNYTTNKCEATALKRNQLGKSWDIIQGCTWLDVSATVRGPG